MAGPMTHQVGLGEGRGVAGPITHQLEGGAVVGRPVGSQYFFSTEANIGFFKPMPDCSAFPPHQMYYLPVPPKLYCRPSPLLPSDPMASGRPCG